MEHGERYRRAREFYDVVTGLWDSWPTTPHPRYRERHLLRSRQAACAGPQGKISLVRGPLNIARPVQGWPVIVQAGASDAGRQLAAETAEAVSRRRATWRAGREFYADVKKRMAKAGRAPDHMEDPAGLLRGVGDTLDEARAKRARLDSLVNYANAIASLSIALGHDASKFDPDGPLPEIPESKRQQERPPARDRSRGAREADRAELAQRLGGYSGLAMVGTPETIADEMQEWLETNGSDGFTVMFPYLPGGSTTSSIAWCRSCSAAASSAATTRARRCARISACRAKNSFSRSSDASLLPSLPAKAGNPVNTAHADARGVRG